MQFKELQIGQHFDFVGNGMRFNSFFDRCEKISIRKYRSLETGLVFQVGTVNVAIGHVYPNTQAK